MRTESSRDGALQAATIKIARFLNSTTGVGTIILAVALGLFIIQPWGWLIAVFMMWFSSRWSITTKLIVTAIVPAAFLIANLLPGFSVGYAAFLIVPAPFISAAILWRRVIRRS